MRYIITFVIGLYVGAYPESVIALGEDLLLGLELTINGLGLHG